MYADLEGEEIRVSVAPEEYESLKQRVDTAEKRVSELEQQLEEERQEKQRLLQHNRTLLRNMSSLFKTASNDVQQKNELISSLREELFRLNPERSEQ